MAVESGAVQRGREGDVAACGVDGGGTGQGDRPGEGYRGGIGGDVAGEAGSTGAILGEAAIGGDVTGDGEQTDIVDRDGTVDVDIAGDVDQVGGQVEVTGQTGQARQGGGAGTRGLGDAGGVDRGGEGEVIGAGHRQVAQRGGIAHRTIEADIRRPGVDGQVLATVDGAAKGHCTTDQRDISGEIDRIVVGLGPGGGDVGTQGGAAPGVGGDGHQRGDRAHRGVNRGDAGAVEDQGLGAIEGRVEGDGTALKRGVGDQGDLLAISLGATGDHRAEGDAGGAGAGGGEPAECGARTDQATQRDVTGAGGEAEGADAIDSAREIDGGTGAGADGAGACDHQVGDRNGLGRGDHLAVDLRGAGRVGEATSEGELVIDPVAQGH